MPTLTRKCNDAGIALIKNSEKCRLKAFKPVETDPWTIGWGDTQNVHEGMQITQEEADQRFEKRLAEFCDGVGKALLVNVTDNQFAALVSLVYNIGITNFHSSTLLRLLNAGNFAGAANEFHRWNKSAGVVLAGLVIRRSAERKLFDT